MDDLEMAIDAMDRLGGKVLLIDQTILPLDSALFVKQAAAHVEQAKACLELALLQRTRDLAERGRGR